jgi:hypothetical protein
MLGRCRTLIWGADSDNSSSIPRYALDMVADDPRTRDALQAVAFGRAVTPEEQAATARALQALRELDERAAAGRTRLADIPAVPAPGVGGVRRTVAAGSDAAPGTIMIEVVDDSQALRDGAWRGGPSRVTESLRRFWVVPVVVASLAVGAVGGSVAARTADKPPASLAPHAQATVPAYNGSYSDPHNTVVAADPVVPDAAALATVDAFFGQPRLASDSFPDEATLTDSGIDPNSTHFVTTAGTTRVWAARGLDGSVLCLVMMTKADVGSSRAACIPEKQFPTEGVSIDAADGASAHWSPDGTFQVNSS